MAWATAGDRASCPQASDATVFATGSTVTAALVTATGASAGRIGRIAVMTFATTGRTIATTCAMTDKIGSTIATRGTAAGIGATVRATGVRGITFGMTIPWRPRPV